MTNGPRALRDLTLDRFSFAQDGDKQKTQNAKQKSRNVENEFYDTLYKFLLPVSFHIVSVMLHIYCECTSP